MGPEGLTVIPEFLSRTEEAELWQTLDPENWRADWTTKIYGDKHLAPMPAWGTKLLNKLVRADHIGGPMNHLRVHLYRPGEGIEQHKDVDSWGDVIVSLSLGCPVPFRFFRPSDGAAHTVWLEPRTLLIMRGDARFEWHHQIPSQKTDIHNGKVFARTLRVSLTFRSAPELY